MDSASNLERFIVWLHGRHSRFLWCAALAFGLPGYIIILCVRDSETSMLVRVLDVAVSVGAGLFWGQGMWLVLGKATADRLRSKSNSDSMTTR